MNVPNIREKREALETLLVCDAGVRAAASTGRFRPEPEDEVRTCFQRDIDRITHSKAFRRLKQKTQVFLEPESKKENLSPDHAGCEFPALFRQRSGGGHAGK